MITQPADLRLQIIDRMAKIGVSQKELARRTGICQPNINRWIRGHLDIKTRNLERILDALGGRLHWGRRPRRARND